MVLRSSIVLLLAASGMSVSACHKQEQQTDQNIVMDNGVMDNAEIEALPADESGGTPSDQLANGEDNPDVNDLNASTNAN